MKKGIFLAIFWFIFFLCPIHFFIIGEGNGYGIQGLFYRYQISPQGSSFIPITREIGYVTSGLIDGKSGISILFWVLGSVIFSMAFLLYLFKYFECTNKTYFYLYNLVIASVLFFLTSSVIQYGFFFSGPAGISILIGVPFLVFLGWSMYNEYKQYSG